MPARFWRIIISNICWLMSDRNTVMLGGARYRGTSPRSPRGNLWQDISPVSAYAPAKIRLYSEVNEHSHFLQRATRFYSRARQACFITLVRAFLLELCPPGLLLRQSGLPPCPRFSRQWKMELIYQHKPKQLEQYKKSCFYIHHSAWKLIYSWVLWVRTESYWEKGLGTAMGSGMGFAIYTFHDSMTYPINVTYKRHDLFVYLQCCSVVSRHALC